MSGKENVKGNERRSLRASLLLACVLSGAACVAARAQGAAGPTPHAREDERLARILERVRAGVERYHRGMFGIAFTEVLTSVELRKDMTPKKAREFVYDSVVLRTELSTDAEDYFAQTSRRLRTVDGKPPKKGGEGREAAASVGGEWLNFLLARDSELYRYALRGEGAMAGRRAFRISLLRPGQGEPRVEWEGTRFRVAAPMEWTVWVDAETYEILQMESRLQAPFEFESPRAFSAGPLGRFGPSRRLKYVREDYTIRFKRVQFKDPEQTLLLPEYAEWVTVIEGASRPRRRTTLQFKDYRRFVSDVKVIEEPEANN